jgi:hypothetical protein
MHGRNKQECPGKNNSQAWTQPLDHVVSVEDKAEKYIVFKFISARQKLSKTGAGLLDNLEMISNTVMILILWNNIDQL